MTKMCFTALHVSMPVRYLVITDLLRDKVFPMISKKKIRPTDPTDPTDCSTVSRTTNFFFGLIQFCLKLHRNRKCISQYKYTLYIWISSFHWIHFLCFSVMFADKFTTSFRVHFRFLMILAFIRAYKLTQKWTFKNL